MSEKSAGQDLKSMNRVIPEGESSCIWVDAGVVSYRLCDRNFECEDCPFDQVMRRESRRDSNVSISAKDWSSEKKHFDQSFTGHETIADLVKKFFSVSAACELPSRRFYSRNHVWAKKIDDGCYRIGLDEYAASLLRDTWSVILPQTGTVSRRNAPLSWAILEDGTIMVRSPLNGKVSMSNLHLKESPSLIVSDPYESGWICEIAGVEDKAVGSNSFDEAAGKKFYDNQFAELEKTIVSELERKPELVGATMMDGGTRPKTLKDLLGPQKYLSILKSLLSMDM